MKGPKGEIRPADTVRCAIAVARIATGEAEETIPSGEHRSGIAGANARRNALSKEKRSEIAKKSRPDKMEPQGSGLIYSKLLNFEFR